MGSEQTGGDSPAQRRRRAPREHRPPTLTLRGRAHLEMPSCLYLEVDRGRGAGCRARGGVEAVGRPWGDRIGCLARLRAPAAPRSLSVGMECFLLKGQPQGCLKGTSPGNLQGESMLVKCT